MAAEHSREKGLLQLELYPGCEHMLRYFLLLIEFILFAGFIWSALWFFVRNKKKHNLGQTIIKVLGSAQIFVTLGLTAKLDSPNFLAYIAIVVFLIATLMFYWSLMIAQQFRGHFNFALSQSTPNRIIRSGPYKYIRHPFYLSYMTAWLGSLFVTKFNLFTVFATVVLTICYNLAATQEEREFCYSDDLRESYVDYMASSWRFIPFIH